MAALGLNGGGPGVLGALGMGVREERAEARDGVDAAKLLAAGRREAEGEAGLRVAGVRAGVVVAVPEALVALKVGVGAGGGESGRSRRGVAVNELDTGLASRSRRSDQGERTYTAVRAYAAS